MLSLPALAQEEPGDASTTSFQVEQFESAPVSGILNVTDARILESLYWSARLATQYSDGALRVVDPDSGEERRAIGARLATEISGGIGLFGYGDLGLTLPVVAYQAGDDLAAFGAPGTQVEGSALGDARIVLRAKLLAWDPGLGLALAVPVVIPTGDSATFNTDGEVTGGLDLLADYRLTGGSLVALNVGYRLRPQRVVLNYVSDDVVRWGAATELPLGASGLALLGSAYGSIPVTTEAPQGSDSRRDTPVELLGGVRYRFSDRFETSVAGGAGLGRSVGTPQYRVVATLSILPKPQPAPTGLVVDDVPVPTPTPEPTPQPTPVEPPAVLTATVTGVVRDVESGEPLAGVSLAVGEQVVRTDEYGRFTATVPANAVVPVAVRHAGYQDQRLELELAPEATQELTVDLTTAALANEGTISGDVRSRDGVAVAAQLMIQSALDVQMVATDAEGKFRTNLPIGQYTVTVKATGYRDKVRRVDVRPGELTIYNFLLSPR